MGITAIILAGGKSVRMGQDKGLVKYKGVPMIEYSIETCKAITPTIAISTNNDAYSRFGYPLIPDNYPELGPIGGLEAALATSVTDDNIVCPCDMPHLHKEILEAALQKRKGHKAVIIANHQGKVFPVVGYYHKSALPVIRHQIHKGEFKLLLLLKELNAEIVKVPSEKILSNFNSPEDLR